MRSRRLSERSSLGDGYPTRMPLPLQTEEVHVAPAARAARDERSARRTARDPEPDRAQRAPVQASRGGRAAHGRPRRRGHAGGGRHWHLDARWVGPRMLERVDAAEQPKRLRGRGQGVGEVGGRDRHPQPVAGGQRVEGREHLYVVARDRAGHDRGLARPRIRVIWEQRPAVRRRPGHHLVERPLLALEQARGERRRGPVRRDIRELHDPFRVRGGGVSNWLIPR